MIWAVLLFVHCSWGMLASLTMPNGDLDIGSLSTFLATVERTVTALQTENKALEKKNVAMMSQVLAELSNVKTELRSVTHEHDLTKFQLANVTSELRETNEKLKSVSCDLNQTLLTAEMRVHIESLLANAGNVSLVPNMTLNGVRSRWKSVEYVLEKLGLEQPRVLSLQNEINAVQMNVQTMNSTLTTSASRVDKVRTDVDMLQRDLLMVETSMNSTMHNVHNAKYRPGPAIAFQAHVRPHQTSYMKHRTIIFADVDLDSGSGFQGRNRYRAPVSGTYLLWASVSFIVDDEMMTPVMTIRTRDGIKAIAMHNKAGINDMQSTMVVLQLKEAEQVWVSSNGDFDLKPKFCSFGGVLLN